MLLEYHVYVCEKYKDTVTVLLWVIVKKQLEGTSS